MKFLLYLIVLGSGFDSDSESESEEIEDATVEKKHLRVIRSHMKSDKWKEKNIMKRVSSG